MANKREPLPVNFTLGNNLMASVAPQNSTTDEEIVADADEPSDNCSGNLSFGKLHKDIYKKQSVSTRDHHKCDSLLTRAIISDSETHSAENSIYSRVGLRLPKRGMSTTSSMSTASMPSTADLTSDASDTSSSELSSPPLRALPVFVLPIGVDRKDTVAIKAHSEDELPKTIQADPNAVVEALGRKRCITFACTTPALSRANSEKPAIKIVEPAPKRQSVLKFACPFKEEAKAPRKLGSPPPSKAHRSPALESAHLNINTHHRRDSAATVIDERNANTPRKSSPSKSSFSSNVSIPRFYEFASSVDESVQSWMNAPQFPSRLLKVDCLLEKEKKIRKLSEEVDEENALEDEEQEEQEAEDFDNFDGEDDDEDDGYKEDEEDDEYEMWSDSDDGNRRDNEEEIAQSDDDEDIFFPKNGTIIPDRKSDRPYCCRNTSDSSVPSVPHSRKRGCSFRDKRTSIRPSTPELPDSTDFVPGTFDEDKVLEDFYLSCMEERKTMNKVVRPQDIDPSFPAEDEDEDEDNDSPVRIGRRRGSTIRHSSHSRSPRGSPAPQARRLRSPPPMSRRGSRTMSPPPNKRRPSFSAKSPPPQGRTGRLRMQFDLNRSSLARSTSLPRHGICGRKKLLRATSTSPKPSKAIPFRKRGALDIVKGLERKRMRRRENVYDHREYRAEAGEGVEKMREVGIFHKERIGANPAPKWMMSV